ncbi:energy transducer TonB [Chitinophaga nivalis]|uniref:Energy transducer TonB n=1 Tax=Chitinophaga nivalis TaxID=2991709 RepID=A0ABT3IKC2_9BACT|nr:energy transducer TonB [Chitinophaga nivalis]MCW3466054.1 energy transducer TonB [Chitinophaga nivalis]MCW3484255.1 energy transducer TonB [Chitinophaga nivalis]
MMKFFLLLLLLPFYTTAQVTMLPAAVSHRLADVMSVEMKKDPFRTYMYHIWAQKGYSKTELKRAERQLHKDVQVLDDILEGLYHYPGGMPDSLQKAGMSSADIAMLQAYATNRFTATGNKGARYYTGTSRFEDEAGNWCLWVTFDKENVVIRTYPGPNNYTYRVNHQLQHVTMGKIIHDTIYVQNSKGALLAQYYYYDKGRLLEINEGEIERVLTPIPDKINWAQAFKEATANREEEVFAFVEMQPSFPEGEPALKQFIAAHMQYPKTALENKVTGIAFVQFVVKWDGTVTDIKSVGRGLGYGLDEEALWLVSIMPKWEPGAQNGKLVNVRVNLPVKFILPGR